MITITTERLILRPQTIMDFDVWYLMYADPKIFHVTSSPGSVTVFMMSVYIKERSASSSSVYGKSNPLFPFFQILITGSFVSRFYTLIP
ncbi:hypothetical protein BADSM9389_24080 [Buttiauxella agrestis]|nr:hypothetical protein BADSM9389_24080 [Buttiauxella agrestis]